jgi:hypothetical protein
MIWWCFFHLDNRREYKKKKKRNFLTSVTPLLCHSDSSELHSSSYRCLHRNDEMEYPNDVTRNQRHLKGPSCIFSLSSSSTLEEFVWYSRSISTFLCVICYSWREENFGMRPVKELAGIQNRFPLNGSKSNEKCTVSHSPKPQD